MRKLREFSYLKYLVSLVVFLLLDSCSVNPVTGKKQLMLLTKDQEIALGLQSDPSVVASFGLYPDETIQNFIDEKGQQMARVSHWPDLEYHFKVLDSPVVNAFALPGGYVYFTRGILAHFNNEAQFAGVLGHEIGHVTARHGASQYSKQMLAQLGLIAGMVIVPEVAQFSELAQTGLGLLFLKFGRDDESQSDRLGVEYSTKIGYDAHEMAGFFTTLGELSGGQEGQIPTFLSTHPNPYDRNEKVAELADKWGSGRQDLKVNRDNYLRLIDGLVYGEDPRQGFFENNYFYHPELKFQFPVPANWKTINTPQQVQMAPEDGRALMLLEIGQGSTLDEAAQALVQKYQLTVVSSQNTQVSGFPAKDLVLQQTNQQSGQTIQIQTYLIQYNNLIYQFLGVATVADFGNYQRTFLETMQNFRTLTDADKLNRQPERIKIKEIDKPTTLQEALRQYNMPTGRHKELAVLNGMQLTDKLTKGTLIKVVGK